MHPRRSTLRLQQGTMPVPVQTLLLSYYLLIEKLLVGLVSVAILAPARASSNQDEPSFRFSRGLSGNFEARQTLWRVSTDLHLSFGRIYVASLPVALPVAGRRARSPSRRVGVVCRGAAS